MSMLPKAVNSLSVYSKGTIETETLNILLVFPLENIPLKGYGGLNEPEDASDEESEYFTLYKEGETEFWIARIDERTLLTLSKDPRYLFIRCKNSAEARKRMGDILSEKKIPCTLNEIEEYE